jgi:hypothetical protein
MAKGALLFRPTTCLKKQKKAFFFEKKKQKTFIPDALAPARVLLHVGEACSLRSAPLYAPWAPDYPYRPWQHSFPPRQF